VVDDQFDVFDFFRKKAVLLATYDFEMDRIARLLILDEGIVVSWTCETGLFSAVETAFYSSRNQQNLTESGSAEW
jgi:hypothetical protein